MYNVTHSANELHKTTVKVFYSQNSVRHGIIEKYINVPYSNVHNDIVQCGFEQEGTVRYIT